MNEEYLRSQGLDLPTLNREYLTQQEQMNQLLQVMSDPQTRNQFLAEYDRLQSQSQGQSAQRPAFPGQQQSPTLIQPASLDDAEYWMGRLNDLSQQGFPMNQIGQVYSQWDEVPEQVWRNLAPYLIYTY
jgi:hypothetical protein